MLSRTPFPSLALTALFFTAGVQVQAQQATGTGFFITIPTESGIPAPTSSPNPGGNSGNGNDLPGLISQLPECALPCFESAASTVECALSDFSCLCSSSNLNSFALNMGSCLTGGLGGDGGPSATDPACSVSSLASLATQICSRVNGRPGQAELSSASAVVSEKLAAATGTTGGPGGNNASPTGNSGARNQVGTKPEGAAMGMLAVVAAYAVLAL